MEQIEKFLYIIVGGFMVLISFTIIYTNEANYNVYYEKKMQDLGRAVTDMLVPQEREYMSEHMKKNYYYTTIEVESYLKMLEYRKYKNDITKKQITSIQIIDENNLSKVHIGTDMLLSTVPDTTLKKFVADNLEKNTFYDMYIKNNKLIIKSI